MKIQDYIHYYIGCRVQHEFITKTKNIELRYGILKSVNTDEIVMSCFVRFENYFSGVRFDSIKPILRKLSDITNEEEKELESIKGTRVIYRSEPNIEIRYDTPETFHWMFKKQFDLFELLENGLAIDSKTLK